MNDTGTRSQVGSSQEWKSYVESREESTPNGDDTRRKAFPGKRLEKLNKKRPFRQHIEAESNSSHEKRVLMVREELADGWFRAQAQSKKQVSYAFSFHDEGRSISHHAEYMQDKQYFTRNNCISSKGAFVQSID